MSAAVLPAIAGCGADDAWLPVSAAELLTIGDFSAGHSWPALSAVLLIDGICESTVTGPGIGVVDEFAPSHAHKATTQTPTVANTPAAPAALRNLRCLLAELRWLCAATRGLAARESAVNE
jgi:hypothetical protein